MAGLSEQYVQERALKYLEKRYRRKRRSKALFAKMEVKTKKTYGSKRADGLIAFRHFFWGVYVVSMEAKSYKTIASMRPYRSEKRWLLASLRMGFYTLLLSGGIYALYRMDDGFVQYYLPLNLFLLGAVLYGLLSRNSMRHKVVDVIDQLKQYPANEQWLAFSKDSVKRLPKKKKHLLEWMCRYEGIGILVVSRFGGVSSWVEPKRKWKWKGDFLQYYSLEKKIRKFMDS